MLRDDVIEKLRQRHEQLKNEFGVESSAIFGSVARGEEHQESDVDILVTFEHTLSLFAFIRLKAYLEGLLSRKVDLVTKNALKPQLRERILKEALLAA